MSRNQRPNMRIAIVGAGIMGRTLAWQLLNRREPVALTLFDQDPIHTGRAAAYTAAGMLSPYSELESTELAVFHMGLASLQRWPDVIASLRQSNPSALDFFNRGTMVVAHQQDQVDFQRFTTQLTSKLPHCMSDDMGLHVQSLNQSQVNKLAPELATRFAHALYLPREAWVDNHQVMAVLGEYLLKADVDWQPNSLVNHIENASLALMPPSAAVYLSSAKQTFDYVIDCRGLGAKQDLSTLNDLSLRGVRGEVITVHAPQVKLQHAVRLMHPRYKLYIAPRSHQHFVIGASQIESEDNGPVTVRSALELLSAAYSIDAGFAEGQIINMSANCRPAYSDNLPKITCDQRVMHINGLFRHGYLLAPILAQQACERVFNPDFASPFTQLIQEVRC